VTKTGTEVDGRAGSDKGAAAVKYRASNGADKGNASDTPQDVLEPLRWERPASDNGEFQFRLKKFVAPWRVLLAVSDLSN
jgi:hypothetical protein